MLHIVSLDLSTGVTFKNIASCLALHSCPPKLLPQVMIHLSAPRIIGVPRCMGFIRNLLLQSFFLRHYQSLLEPQGSFCFLVEKQATFGSPSFILRLIWFMPSSFFYTAMISSLKVGTRTMLNNARLGSTRVLDSSPVMRVAGK
jgi:hypothetical protein